MTEEIFASLKANPGIQPHLSIWGSEITAYLALNGLTAGAMVLAASAILAGREAAAPFAARRLPLIGLVALAVGMTALTLDLERIVMAWRFFTALELTSSMSRGTWALMAVFPALTLLVLAQLRAGYPPLARLLESIPLIGPLIGWVMSLAYDYRRVLAAACLLLGIDLGLHTGVLLASFNARPFWHSALLPPLTLASGLTSGAALVVLCARNAERAWFARIAAGLVLAQLILIALFVELMHSGAAIQQEAIAYLLGGDATRIFWLGLAGGGLALPLLLLLVTSWRPRIALSAVAGAVLILAGSVLFGQITLDLGQRTGWTHVENQFNPDLLNLLTSRSGAPHGN